VTSPTQVPEGIDVAKPNVARLYDYFLGGDHHYAADRELARRLLQSEPNARELVRHNREFLGRAVRFMSEAGIRQFIDLGSGIPTQENVHEIAQQVNPAARVVYVDIDPVAVAHGKQILRGNPFATVINEDFRRPAAVVGNQAVRELIDLSQPVGLLMVAVLHFVPDSDDPAGVIAGFAERMAPGSYLAISHATHDSKPNVAAEVVELYKSTTAPANTRTHAEILRFFDGFDLVEPGLVWVPLWRTSGPPPENPEQAWFYVGVGRRG
jgi:S-adenosyl methyltransferase